MTHDETASLLALIRLVAPVDFDPFMREVLHLAIAYQVDWSALLTTVDAAIATTPSDTLRDALTAWRLSTAQTLQEAA